MSAVNYVTSSASLRSINLLTERNLLSTSGKQILPNDIFTAVSCDLIPLVGYEFSASKVQSIRSVLTQRKVNFNKTLFGNWTVSIILDPGTHPFSTPIFS